MRSILVALLLFTLLVFVSCGSEEVESSVLSGSISGTDAIALTRVEDLSRKKLKLVERIEIGNDGRFEMAFENLEPHLYELNFPNGKKVQFVHDGKSSIEFEGDADQPDAISVKGSADNEVLKGYETFRKESLERLVLSVRKRLKEMPVQSGPEFEELGKLEVTNYEKHKTELLDYVKKNMGTSLAVYATSSRWPSDPASVETVVTSFAKAHPDLELTKRLNERLEVLRKTSIGGTAAEIKMRDGEGKEISLRSSRGAKYTLIDFWGSWCGPCRREAETLAASYAKYKPLGFEIFGVALESDLQKWRDAKDADKRIWTNVVSLKELETEAAFDYGITALPANFLIDQDGKIVARDLHDEELTAKLEELFKN